MVRIFKMLYTFYSQLLKLAAETDMKYLNILALRKNFWKKL